MKSKITKKFEELKKFDKRALITYITAGDPDIKDTEKLIYAMERAGADIVELGIPYSDPLADGPVIQRAAQRALKKNVNIDDIFDMVKEVRKNTQLPLAFLMYYNSILRYGINKFIEKCKDVGMDGLIVADLPLEERKEFKDLLKNTGVDLIPLVAPTSRERIKMIVEDASGFIYCVSSLGVTGTRSSFSTELKDFMDLVRSYTDVPTAIGFGISGTEAIRELKDYSDGLIVGSAIIKKIEEGLEYGTHLEKVEEFVKELKSAFK
ncbi:tryptophan synthase subunit alpha [Alkalibacter mobilis]|uniref:tryptophan synthase subunit alpha n=1 Tax=Alkalibacter mobilis TaxID=2787712 RepID=UPI00189FB720|nr:tryptophan synthase subunit alpha [Alkalibacter mobilis]MBF7096997.1 tryptophan synthase subunit alpha [Alkalibacter mobilis]